MELLKVFSLLTLLVVVNSSKEIILNKLLSDEKSFENVTEFVKILIQNETKRKPGQQSKEVHDIAFLDFDYESKNDLVEKILFDVLSERNPTILASRNSSFKHQRLRKASFIIIISEINDAVSLKALIEKNLNFVSQQILLTKMQKVQQSSYWTRTTKFIFITRKSADKFIGVISFFDMIGALNFVVICFDKKLEVYSGNLITRTISKVTANSSEAFADKLRDMHGYTYRIAVTNQYPRMASRILKGRRSYHGIDLLVMLAICEKQNSRIIVSHFLKFDAPDFGLTMGRLLSRQLIEFTLNTIFPATSDYPDRLHINTYDENGHCALVPVPPRLSFFQFVLTPFDIFSWLALTISVVICSIIWNCFRVKLPTSNSGSYFIFGLIASFVGQSIPFRESRKIQTTILQLCILMTFIMGNAYQSIIISSMSTSRDGIRFKTFQELFDSELRFKVDPIVYTAFKNSADDAKLVERMERALGVPDFKQLAEDNFALIARCDMIHAEMNKNVKTIASNYFYTLPDKIMPFFEQFELAANSPFQERLQLLHNYMFESGIRHYYQYLVEMVELARMNREFAYIENEEYLLNLKDDKGIFIVLLV